MGDAAVLTTRGHGTSVPGKFRLPRSVPQRFTRCVEPSMSVKRNVTAPFGGSVMAGA
jgi:hypothetical protein